MELGGDIPSEWKSSKQSTNSNPEKGHRNYHKRAGGTVKDGAQKKQRVSEVNKAQAVVVAEDHDGYDDENDAKPKSKAKNGQPERCLPLRDEILRNLQKDTGHPIVELLEVDSLIYRIPYKKMLTSLCNRDTKCAAPHIPYVTRAYEEAFMHEAISKDQRQCARGNMCECMFIDKANPFICVQFLLPGEKQKEEPNLCVVCCRATTQQMYYDVMFENQNFAGTIQQYGNLHSQEGEYSLHAMLIAAPSAPIHILPLPIVAHQRNRYYVVVRGGVRHLQQSRVYFQSTPSCTAEHGL